MSSKPVGGLSNAGVGVAAAIGAVGAAALSVLAFPVSVLLKAGRILHPDPVLLDIRSQRDATNVSGTASDSDPVAAPSTSPPGISVTGTAAKSRTAEYEEFDSTDSRFRSKSIATAPDRDAIAILRLRHARMYRQNVHTIPRRMAGLAESVMQTADVVKMVSRTKSASNVLLIPFLP